MKNRLFVCPKNDAEALRIAEILKERGEKVLITGQGWGASWENLEEEVKKEVEELWKKYQLGLSSRPVVYGIELQGKALNVLCENIDHHAYADEDRSNSKSSLEQVAEIINYEMSLYDKFVAANDTGYIPKMLELAKEYNLSEKETQDIIKKVRALDRKGQGVTEEQEEQAEKAISNMIKVNDKIVIKSPHSKCATYTDRLFGEYKELIIFSDDGEVNYYGKKSVIDHLFNDYQGWKGGDIENDNGFWGGYPPKEDFKKIEKLILKGGE